MKENDYRFGNFVCQLREEKGLTQAEVAEQLDVTPAAVSKWENGESKPRTEKLFELARLLDVTAEELMNGERKPYDQPTIAYNTNALPQNDTRFRRIGAFFLDVLFCEMAGIMTVPFAFLLFRSYFMHSGRLTVLISIIALTLILLRDFIFNGRSLGKRITRMTVANAADGSRPKWYKLILRNLPYFIYFIDFFVLIINGRSLGDMLTDTFTPPYMKRKTVNGQTIAPQPALAQSFTTPPRKKRKIFIIVACVVLGVAMLFTVIFSVAFHFAKQSPAYPLAIEYLSESDSLTPYDLQESDFVLHSYSSRRQNGTRYEIFGFWVKGNDLYVTVRTENGKAEVYRANDASSPPL
ncbi:MAG: helix-turn-helix domain-containing protein [Ruminococcus sp.]|nr:helix-turn-helix domain-containing protein [Ruminococcus sp.]